MPNDSIISRRWMQILLGIVWLVDGLLQLKPQMFTKAFVNQVLLSVSQSQPVWIAHGMTVVAHWIAPNIQGWNLLFALIQLALGVALILNILPRLTLIASFVWMLVVWGFGEGFGALFTGQSSALTGAPGAVLLYGLIGISVWPDKNGQIRWRRQGVLFAHWSLVILWLMNALLQFQPAYLSNPHLVGSTLTPWLANWIGASGVLISVILGIVQLLLAGWIASRRAPHSALWASIILSFLFWWLGQGFGQIFTPLATDFNSGLLYILLSFCAWPRTTAQRSYGQVGTTLTNPPRLV
ncbi:hypothetical protein D2Q93_07810 [Alicyclobacillaceae bacterium I2511]|nr:hypothetical protein D2Q93_07810 [Alicyclobacillaceae bacterium I2511]